MRKPMMVLGWIALAGLTACGDVGRGSSPEASVARASMAEIPVQGKEEPEGTAPVRDLLIRTRDYVFDAPARVESGATRIRLINEGPDFHHVWLIRLPDDREIGELVASLKERPVTPDWAVDVGGPNTPGAPGESNSAVVDLEPGRYALVCLIPGPDGELHIMKDMARELRVVAATDPAPLPQADLVMTMDDYNFAMSGRVRPGRRTIRVENAAAQSHEVVIVHLQEGRRAEDFLAFLGTREGTTPGRMIGGVTGLSQGEANVIEVDFQPGTYAFLCFAHDAEDGQPHVAHGMFHTFRVQGG